MRSPAVLCCSEYPSYSSCTFPFSTELSEEEQIRLSMLLSKQDEVHGTNMFDALTAEDEREVDYWLSLGYRFGKIALFLFQRKFGASTEKTPQMS